MTRHAPKVATPRSNPLVAASHPPQDPPGTAARRHCPARGGPALPPAAWGRGAPWRVLRPALHRGISHSGFPEKRTTTNESPFLAPEFQVHPSNRYTETHLESLRQVSDPPWLPTHTLPGDASRRAPGPRPPDGASPTWTSWTSGFCAFGSCTRAKGSRRHQDGETGKKETRHHSVQRTQHSAFAKFPENFYCNQKVT